MSTSMFNAENKAAQSAAVYSRMIAVTNRTLYAGSFRTQLENIAALHPHAVILRERDLEQEAYRLLAEETLAICRKAGVPCFLHTDMPLARDLGCDRIHLSMRTLRGHKEEAAGFRELSVSCHSLAEAQEAVDAGATQIVLGTIFATACKPGKQGSGLGFLQDVCRKIPVPVYAIGGITPEKLPALLEAGAAGGCMMSGFAG